MKVSKVKVLMSDRQLPLSDLGVATSDALAGLATPSSQSILSTKVTGCQ